MNSPCLKTAYNLNSHRQTNEGWGKRKKAGGARRGKANDTIRFYSVQHVHVLMVS